MKTTINIPDGLLDEIRLVFGDRSRTDVICNALEEYLLKERREKLLKLRGTLSLHDLTEDMESLELKEDIKWPRKR